MTHKIKYNGPSKPMYLFLYCTVNQKHFLLSSLTSRCGTVARREKIAGERRRWCKLETFV
jgi:hypothetical protein